MNSYVNSVAIARECFVDGVVDDFEHEMMEPSLGRIADVHARPLADGFEPFEDANRVGAVPAGGDIHLLQKRPSKRVLLRLQNPRLLTLLNLRENV